MYLFLFMKKKFLDMSQNCGRHRSSDFISLAPRAGNINDTNQEGRTRSGINTSVSPDSSAETEGLHEGLD